MTFDMHASFENGHSPAGIQDAGSGWMRHAEIAPPPQPARREQGQRHTRTSIARLLHKHDIAPTRQRIEIAYTLFEREQHLSADQILSAVNARDVKSSKATVYNTLKLFREKKLVRELIIDPTKVFYDRNTEPHHHFYDVESGELTDIPAQNVHIEGLPPLPAGVIAEGIDIIVRTRRG